jgi:hypothetical protein
MVRWVDGYRYGYGWIDIDIDIEMDGYIYIEREMDGWMDGLIDECIDIDIIDIEMDVLHDECCHIFILKPKAYAIKERSQIYQSYAKWAPGGQ